MLDFVHNRPSLTTSKRVWQVIQIENALGFRWDDFDDVFKA
jgi:hypothetical protein